MLLTLKNKWHTTRDFVWQKILVAHSHFLYSFRSSFGKSKYPLSCGYRGTDFAAAAAKLVREIAV